MARGLAAVFEQRHGALVRKKYAKSITTRTLRNALRRRIPSIIVTDGVLKVWLRKYGPRKLAYLPGRDDKFMRRMKKKASAYRSSAASSPYRVQLVDEFLDQVDGAGLSRMPRPASDALPAYSCMLRRRINFLSMLLRTCEQERGILLEKLCDITREGVGCAGGDIGRMEAPTPPSSSSRRRWASCMLCPPVSCAV